MRSVNLIPREDRSGGIGRSGGAAYGVLGALAVLVLVVAAYTLSSNTVSDRKAQVARVQHQAEAVQARADKLSAFDRFTSLRARRVQTVTSIAKSRFDWAHAMHELARVVPHSAWLSSVSASVTPDVSVQGGGGAGGSLRASENLPAAEIVGCTPNQGDVARMMVRLRQIDLVNRVTLVESSKRDDTGGASATANDSDCRINAKVPKFDILIFFDAPPVAAAPAAPAGTTPGATGATAAAPVAPAGSAQPASTTTPAPTQ